MIKPNLKSLLLSSVLLLSPFANASLEDAQLAANEGRFEEALQEFNYLADRGYAPAIYELAKMYEGGSVFSVITVKQQSFTKKPLSKFTLIQCLHLVYFTKKVKG